MKGSRGGGEERHRKGQREAVRGWREGGRMESGPDV